MASLSSPGVSLPSRRPLPWRAARTQPGAAAPRGWGGPGGGSSAGRGGGGRGRPPPSPQAHGGPKEVWWQCSRENRAKYMCCLPIGCAVLGSWVVFEQTPPSDAVVKKPFNGKPNSELWRDPQLCQRPTLSETPPTMETPKDCDPEDFNGEPGSQRRSDHQQAPNLKPETSSASSPSAPSTPSTASSA